jgi:dipeptidyl aminopeptidase/acylaminoacyl peptidase
MVMKNILFFLTFFFVSRSVIAQSKSDKPPIDTSIFGKWPSVQHPQISNNGKYVMYYIDNKPVKGKTLVFQSSDGAWKREDSSIVNYTAILSPNNKFGIYLMNDTLSFIKLGTSIKETVSGVASFRPDDNSLHDWLSYHTSDKSLTVRNLTTSRQFKFENVVDYAISSTGNLLVFKSICKSGTIKLNWVSLASGKVKTFFKDQDVANIVIAPNGKQVAFIVITTNPTGHTERVIWYYKEGMTKAEILADITATQNDSSIKIGDLQRFSMNGERLFFSFKESPLVRPRAQGIQVDIWSFTDTKLQSEQLSRINETRDFQAVIYLPTKAAIRLEYPNEHMQYENNYSVNDDFALIKRKMGDAGGLESKWNKSELASYYVMSTINGSRRSVLENTLLDATLSPNRKYLIYFDPVKQSYFSYQLFSRQTVNITNGIATNWLLYSDRDTIYKGHPNNLNYPITGWAKNDEALLLQDQHDIWLIDPAGQNAPRCITNNFGLKNNIVFRIAQYPPQSIIELKGNIILSGFNYTTKENGYYSVQAKVSKNPILLTNGNYMYFAPENDRSHGMPPLKALHAECYLVQRMSSAESPNYFTTKDFKKFWKLSNVHPEINYNWLTTELINWTAIDGRECQGILYKPGNFDSTKKYPVIFHIYNKKSHLLNEYLPPAASTGSINIPYFVSRGYLVFTPDMHNQIGNTGKSIINVISSAVEVVSKMACVDSNKLGIQGFSFGGYETNFVITHINKFAAAMSGAGATDLVSLHGGLHDFGHGASAQDVVENGMGLNTTPWENPIAYIENSPIFYVNRVETPVLMLNNRNDGAVDYYQAIELFTALRRLGKPSWFLQYDNEGHGVMRFENSIDYTTRMTQFFDYYLMKKPAPIWMLEGIPAKEKGIDAKLKLDNTRQIKANGPLN